jgi:hypothetical protein
VLYILLVFILLCLLINMKLSRGVLFTDSKSILKSSPASSPSIINYGNASPVQQPAGVPAFKYPLLKYLHRMLLPLASSPRANKIVADFQEMCGLELDGSASNKPLKYLFTVASLAGEEIYSLMPALMWVCIDAGIPFMTNFGVMLLFGQLTKDFLGLPRPPATWKGCKRPIIKLEKHFETEYGFPSTHTMSGLMPLTVALAFHRQGHYVSDNVWMGCGLYLVVVALSRLYLGVHSLLDIVGGLVQGLVFVFLLHGVGDALESVVYFSHFGPVLTFISLYMFLYWYPKTAPWSASYGTSTQFYGTWLGGSLSYYAITNIWPRLGQVLRAVSIVRVGRAGLWLMAQQVAVGMIMIAINKVGVKWAATKFFMKLRKMGVLVGDPAEEVDAFGTKIPETKTYCIEIPVRFVLFEYALLLRVH